MLFRTSKTRLFMMIFVISSTLLHAEDRDPSGQDYAPAASPDGKHIVYYSYRAEGGHLSDLYIVDIATGVERRITKTPGLFEIEPGWSPDGQNIVFAAGPSMKELALYSIKPDGSDYRLFYDGDGRGAPNWSPDGKSMVFWYEYENGSSDLLIENFEADAQTLLEIGFGGHNSSPAWSPDGNFIAFSHRDIDDSGRAGDTASDADGIYMINIQSHAITKLSDEPSIAFGLKWSPDGNHIYYTSAAGNGMTHIYRIASSGGTATRVSADVNGPAYFPAFMDEGKTLLFAGSLNQGVSRIMAMPINQLRQPGKPVTHAFVN